MKVFLPSHGILGQRTVEMKIPTFSIIHEMQSYNDDDVLKKYRLLELLTNADFSKITAMDAEYLFTIAAFSLLFNSANYSLTCSKCEKKFTKTVNLLEQGVLDLKLKSNQLPYTKRVNLKKYSYNILSAAQELEAYEWAQYEENTELAFDDAKVAFIMGKTTNDVDWVRSLPVSIYLAAFLFQRINYHGIDNLISTKCPDCGSDVKFRFKITPKVLDFDIDRMMSKFASVSEYLTFEDFMRMSIVDFNAFVNALNKKFK